jgi:hypothetical protein
MNEPKLPLRLAKRKTPKNTAETAAFRKVGISLLDHLPDLEHPKEKQFIFDRGTDKQPVALVSMAHLFTDATRRVTGVCHKLFGFAVAPEDKDVGGHEGGSLKIRKELEIVFSTDSMLADGSHITCFAFLFLGTGREVALDDALNEQIRSLSCDLYLAIIHRHRSAFSFFQ